MEELLNSAPTVLTELTTEFVRRYSEEMDKDPKSQTIACLLLAMRSASLLCAAGRLLDPRTLDGLEVMKRAFLEARDLLMTFRFNEKGIKDKVEYWFEGKLDNSWNADRKKCEQFLERQNLPGAEFAKRWSSQSALAHPTKYAAQNSAVCVMRWAVPQPQGDAYYLAMNHPIGDYLACIVSLIVLAIMDWPDLISLGCDLDRMPSIEPFRATVGSVVVPILNSSTSNLPPGSYRGG